MTADIRRIAILGASGNALDILDIIDALGCWEVAGVFDDKAARGSVFADLPVLGRLEEAAAAAAPGGPLDGAAFVNAIASERTHRRKADIIASTGLDEDRFATLVHPAAAVSRRAVLGRGVCIGPGCAVSANVTIGAHAWMGGHVVIGHDATIGSGATLAPAVTIAGGVRVGALAYVGSGAVLRPGITIGDGALIGMGAVVLADVPPEAVMVGNPARHLDRR
ncbi:NeuD/PglB/VioB family sugar acetyltransferase [Roseomonas sp. HJA6]|uniref:NeuD/PglB/VioB family sugar acetyltransferase n=1 Tax=Roseomonas alba TaxID=2846776 RepID=A0ABS7A5K0_9PROT|nr:NeuD/PglB/VioB family sugar acetyltransferase [Neoroseomonas alba]MBW6397555.1 NeuD/PglB/VioB family sugar acetyltransferase [Neoroseomonas alba]